MEAVGGCGKADPNIKTRKIMAGVKENSDFLLSFESRAQGDEMWGRTCGEGILGCVKPSRILRENAQIFYKSTFSMWTLIPHTDH